MEKSVPPQVQKGEVRFTHHNVGRGTRPAPAQAESLGHQSFSRLRAAADGFFGEKAGGL
jgi:hypothetical protein